MLKEDTSSIQLVTYCCMFHCEIMPATFATTFLFILQGSALAYLGCGGRIQGTFGSS